MRFLRLYSWPSRWMNLLPTLKRATTGVVGIFNYVIPVIPSRLLSIAQWRSGVAMTLSVEPAAAPRS